MSIASSIAVSGMNVAARRLQVSASNVANALTDGPLPTSTNAGRFPSHYIPKCVNQNEVASGGTNATAGAISPSYVSKFDASALYADQNGIVASPNIDLTNEVIQQIIARYTFAANVRVLQTDAQLTATLLNIIV